MSGRREESEPCGPPEIGPWRSRIVLCVGFSGVAKPGLSSFDGERGQDQLPPVSARALAARQAPQIPSQCPVKSMVASVDR